MSPKIKVASIFIVLGMLGELATVPVAAVSTSSSEKIATAS